MFQKPKRHISRVFIHCSASDNPKHNDISVIRKWHTDPKPEGRGWSDVGYHYFIKKDGTIQTGRPLERTPAAQKGHNKGTIAICLHGLKEGNFTQEQKRSLIRLCTVINRAYNSKITFHGHREVEPLKTCPVFDYKQWLSLDEYGRMPDMKEKKLWSKNTSPTVPLPALPSSPPRKPTLKTQLELRTLSTSENSSPKPKTILSWLLALLRSLRTDG